MEKIVEYLKDEDLLVKPSSFWAVCIILICGAAGLDSFIEKIIPSVPIRVVIYITLLIAWVIFWFYKRYDLPENEEGKIGIFLCISTEESKEKIRLHNNLVRRLNDLIFENQLTDLVRIVTLKDYQVTRIRPVLETYRACSAAIDKGQPKDIQAFAGAKKDIEKIRKATNCHFFIYGTIEQRNDPEATYFIRTDSIVFHTELPRNIQQQLQNDFLTYWFGQISFLEKLDFRGFTFSADLLLLGAKLIIGIAALISGDPATALRLHETLEKDLNKFNPLPNEFIELKNKLTLLMAEENFLLARAYFVVNDLINTRKHLARCLQLSPNSSGAFILESNLDFVYDRDPQKALRSVEKAKNYSGEDGTWRYNKAFLLMYTEKFNQALPLYRQIVKHSFPHEDFVLNQVYEFNEGILKNEPNKIQAGFIIGFGFVA